MPAKSKATKTQTKKKSTVAKSKPSTKKAAKKVQASAKKSTAKKAKSGSAKAATKKKTSVKAAPQKQIKAKTTKTKPTEKVNKAIKEKLSTAKKPKETEPLKLTSVKAASEAKPKVEATKEKTKKRSSFNASIANHKPARLEAEKVANASEKNLDTTENNEPDLIEGMLDKRKAKLIEKYIRTGKEWSSLSGILEEHAVDYKMSESYKAQMAIKHRNMGIGYVMSVGHNKMLVCFEEGPKNLIMNYRS